jgi:hypothetical protein
MINKEPIMHRIFKKRSIKIADSTFLEYCIERLFFSKFGYSSAEKAYKQGIKLHVLYDYSMDNIEKFIETSANTHDSRVADNLLSDIKDCILLIDKGYQKLNRFVSLDSKGVKFIIPFKSNLKYTVLETNIIHYETGNVSIETIELSNGLRVRKINVLGFELITNDLSLQWYEIVALYEIRWEIELLFKKLKQLWRINKPLFRNHNSIMSFICITLMAALILKELAVQFHIEENKLFHNMARKVSALLIVETCK